VRWLNAKGLLSDKRMDALRERRGSDDYRAAQGVMRGVLVNVVNESYEEQLAAMTCPVRLVWGERDHTVPVEVAERCRSVLGERATLQTLPGIGHLTPLEAPRDLRAAVDALL
jgi:pimeloyl-ACP methyl ester carboxylesterase